MKAFLKIVFLITLLNSLILAQNKDLPRMIDEFGEVSSEDLTARLEVFSLTISENPNTKGYIIIYRDKALPFGYPIHFGAVIQNFLVKSIRFPRERFEVINGGLRDERKTELWLFPNGSKPPIADSINEKLETSKSVLFDGFNYPTPYDGAGCCSIDGYTEEAKKASLDYFARQLKEQSTVKAYLIFYGQYCTDCSSSARYSRNGKYLGVTPDNYFDSPATAARILRKEKNYLLKRHGVDTSKVITINGGYRKWQAIELWFVPKGGEIPKPKPNTFPKKRRQRKR